MGKARRSQLVYDMDEILSQRSQVSMSQFGSEAGVSSNEFSLRRRGPPLQKTQSSKSLPRRRPPTGLSSDEEIDDFNGQAGLVNPMRVTRRHSSAIDNRRHSGTSIAESVSSSSSSSISLPPSELLETRLNLARHSTTVPRRSGVYAASRLPEEDDVASLPEQRGGFLSCFGCFKSKPLELVNESAATNLTELKDPLSATMHRVLDLLSENVEIDVLDKIDQRVVFLLFAAISGEPLLTIPEYEECDEWVDWLTLGFSSSTIDAFERDINRNGSQAMGLLFQLFFALEYTYSARICAIVVRNIHFDPSALFGLFAINCAKWSRDAVVAAMRRFDEKPSSPDGPPLFVSAKPFVVSAHGRTAAPFAYFMPVMDWWVTRGSVGDISVAERRFTDSTETSLRYESFKDELSFDDRFSSAEEGPPELSRPKAFASRNTSSAASLDSGRRHVRLVDRMECRIPDIDVNVQEDWLLLRQAVIVGGLYYSYCVLSFTKFWLQKELISVETDVARERLNNAYLDKEFVSRLKLSPNTTVADLLKVIEREQEKVDQLWAASGWTKEDLVGSNVQE